MLKRIVKWFQHRLLLAASGRRIERKYFEGLTGLETAKRVLAADEDVPFGIFGIISAQPYFPPHAFLNEFLMQGSDPCDQDGWIRGWTPFAVSPEEYREVLAWWAARHPGAVASDLGVGSWGDWVHMILNPEDWGFPDGLPPPAEQNAPPDRGSK